MKKVLFIALVLLVACGKETEEEPEVITRVEYRVSTSVDGPMIKFLDSNGDEQINYLSDTAEWVHTFNYTTPLDSVGFKVKDFITWIEYKIILNTDTVVNYIGPCPEGGFAHWYGIYYQMP